MLALFRNVILFYSITTNNRTAYVSELMKWLKIDSYVNSDYLVYLIYIDKYLYNNAVMVNVIIIEIGHVLENMHFLVQFLVFAVRIYIDKYIYNIAVMVNVIIIEIGHVLENMHSLVQFLVLAVRIFVVRILISWFRITKYTSIFTLNRIL